MNKLTATVLSTISLSGAALIAAALFSTTTAHSAPAVVEAPKGDVVIGAISVVDAMSATSITVLQDVVVKPRAAKTATPFTMTHFSTGVKSETVNVYHRTRSLSKITFDLAPQL